MSTRYLVTLVCLAAALTTAAVASGANGKGAPAPQLSGTWITTVSLTNPPPGVDATFQALDTFVAGGGILVSSSQSHPTTRSLAHGSCVHTRAQTFACTFAWFRFDPATGSYLGMQRVRRTMTLSNDQKSFQAADIVEVLAPDGTVVASIKGSEAGRRLGI
ncbi:MAG TPA: hypothetical protein VFA19_12550 [Gaiellaceae bacterium]|nr:hypothetical protein [Gaiellaceae bacterium]